MINVGPRQGPWAALVGCALLAGGSTAWAQTDAAADDLAQLLSTPVYAASKYKQTAAEVPAAVTVLTQGDIRSFGWRTLGEVLNAARGVFLRYDRGYVYAGVRGVSRPGDYSSRLLVLIDGVRANENIYDSVLLGREFPLDVSLIERVEFIPGPGSAVYGSNAVFGVINVVTRSAASLRGNTLALGFDSDSGRKVFTSTARELNVGTLLLSASVEVRPGRDLYFPEFDHPPLSDGVARRLDGERDRKLMTRFQGGEWAFSALASQRDKQIPNAPFGLVFGDRNAMWSDRLVLMGGTWQRQLEDGAGWYAQAGVGAYNYSELGRYEPRRTLQQGTSVGRWWQAEVRHTGRWGSAQQWLVGMDVQRNFKQLLATSNLESAQVQDGETRASGTRLGLFVNDEIMLATGLRLALAIRADRESSGQTHLTPRFSLWWQAQPNVVAKLIVGAAYREPNVSELAPASPDATPVAALRREQVKSKELVLDWRAVDRLRIAVSVYRNRIHDPIEQVAAQDKSIFVYSNAGNVDSRGVGLEAEYLDNAGWRVRASANRQWVTTQGGQPVSNAPSALFKLHATAPLPGLPLRWGLELQGTGPRLTLAGALLPWHTVANATALYDPPGSRWSLALSVYNLANLRYSDPAGPEHVGDVTEQDRRSLALRWSLNF